MLPELIIAALVSGAMAEEVDVGPPEKVDVLPVFFVPKGESLPTQDQKARLMKHVKWAQSWYREALGGRDTFRIAKPTSDVYSASESLAFYKQHAIAADGANHSSYFVRELLEYYGANRFNCPYIFATIVMSPRENFPNGGGIPFNGSFNRGGGFVNMSSLALDRFPSFQCTLRHELGHSFGLPHVKAYGYDMKTSPSVMSYNRNHYTNGFEESATPQRLIPEDIRGLALNKRCFATLQFDPGRDNPDSDKLAGIVFMANMNIVGQPSCSIDVSTNSGSLAGTKPINVVQRWIRVSKGPFIAGRMWQSDASSSGWVSLDLTFPVPVTLARMGIHTQHSGQYHAAQRVRIEVKDDDKYRDVVEQDLKSVDAIVSMPPTRGTSWRVHLRAGKSKVVVVRGLRFFNETGEIFPPAVPYNGP